MKKLFFSLLFAAVLSCISASAQKIDLGKFVIDKNVCTITNKETGKTFDLYGDVEIVDHFEDISIKLVDHFEDIDVRLVDSSNPSCCEFRKVKHFAKIKVRIVEHFEDITVRLVEHFPGINH